MRRFVICGGPGCLLVIALSATPLHAQGYMDPGSGSLLIQILLGGVVGLGAILKLYWGRIRGALPGAKKAPGDGD